MSTLTKKNENQIPLKLGERRNTVESELFEISERESEEWSDIGSSYEEEDRPKPLDFTKTDSDYENSSKTSEGEEKVIPSPVSKSKYNPSFVRPKPMKR